MTTKGKVLRALTDGQAVSGEQLGEILGLSRNAVWKAIAQLRKEGYEIEGATRRGYRLKAAPDVLTRQEMNRFLTAKVIAREAEFLDTTDSTNNRAKVLAAAGAPHGFLVTANEQSGGRGRMGRSFFSPGSSGVYLSYILRPKTSPERAALITSLAAVAVAQAIESMVDADVRIKWVNDLYLGGKKICGILSEAGISMETGQLDYVIVGVGVNVLPMSFPPELSEIATSVGNETGVTLSRSRLVAEISNRLEAMYGQLETGAFLEESRRRSNVIGRDVLVIEGGRTYPARALDLDDRGQLVIRTAEGVTHLGYGEVSLKLTPEVQRTGVVE